MSHTVNCWSDSCMHLTESLGCRMMMRMALSLNDHDWRRMSLKRSCSGSLKRRNTGIWQLFRYNINFNWLAWCTILFPYHKKHCSAMIAIVYVMCFGMVPQKHKWHELLWTFGSRSSRSITVTSWVSLPLWLYWNLLLQDYYQRDLNLSAIQQHYVVCYVLFVLPVDSRTPGT